MGLSDRFILTGLVPPTKIPELCSAMDLLVHPSRREGLARALPQGSLAGIPVLTYDVDGNREALVDKETGFLVPAFDQKELRECVVSLIEDPSRRKAMGLAGRDFAIRRLDARVMVDELEKVYLRRT